MYKTAFATALLLFGATKASTATAGLTAEIVAEAAIQTAHETGASLDIAGWDYAL